MAQQTPRGFNKPDVADSYDINEMVGSNMDLIDAEFDNVATLTQSEGTFPGGSASYTQTDANVTANSFVVVTINPSIRPAGVWSATASQGEFTITSTNTEPVNIAFDYAVFNAK